MYILKKTLIAAAVISVVVGFLPTTAQATKCGTSDKITIAEMTWLSASVLAIITQRILKVGYGCNAETIPGDTVPSATSMLTKGSPDIAPELWISTASTIWNKIQKKGNVYKAGDIFASGGKEGWWIPDYVAKGILAADPFQTLDQGGTGQLVQMGTTLGRKTRKNLKVGICGEHGGDPASVMFCHSVGLDYVSCSPFRVPIARLAAAQAVLAAKRK